MASQPLITLNNTIAKVIAPIEQLFGVTLPHAGYWRTCWQPWPYPPDWSHCCAPPSSVALHAMGPLTTAAPQGAEPPCTQLPPPRKFDGNPPKALN